MTLVSFIEIAAPHHSLWDSLLSVRCSGGRLNKKDGLTRYGDSHVKDKTS